MPIVHCIISDVDKPVEEYLANTFATKIGVDPNEVTISLLPAYRQYGGQYKILAHLYLPDLWQPNQVDDMQQALLDVLVSGFKVDSKEILILTQLLKSGRVIDRGKVVNWKN
ncbi:hypothetical protein E1176_06650 [Fulvivirga sp. RKSG066]|uniref:hypothetical protein n=1 Tax=Fulvivirga aurantia TaxID=2529383 RepID=UPI0012BCFDBB|nr:hypothetical protein [Fulvivirga aurantia]MTI20695.1 hypothetical protein [Fulvivirga aurantia]